MIGGDEPMFVEELTKIRDSEAKADEILKKAKLDAKQSLEAARSEAVKLTDEARAKGKSIYDALVAEGEAEADRQYETFLEKTRDDCRVMKESAKKREDKVIDYIAERIVGASVDH
ncbi:hypothetical protein ACPW7J_12020 [Ihubacter sp. rT4E-8]|uniref:hypothetical protein n=1 Tax=Ihubacter sp. rT4E-8 TaxID=3242369 RepID=UPI003CE900B9